MEILQTTCDWDQPLLHVSLNKTPKGLHPFDPAGGSTLAFLGNPETAVAVARTPGENAPSEVKLGWKSQL